MCKILANYALKMGHRPIFIDLDVESNQIVPIGCIGAARLKFPMPNDDITDDSICYYNGYRSTSLIKKLYKKQVQHLSELVEK